MASILEAVHDKEIPFLNYNDENALSCVITLCYLYARDEYQIEREAKSGKGYCDYLFSPRNLDRPAIVLELKVDTTPEAAIAGCALRRKRQMSRCDRRRREFRKRNSFLSSILTAFFESILS